MSRFPILQLVALFSVFLAPVDAATLVVDANAPGASDQNPGTAEKPLQTISAAAELAQPGDTVRVHAGTYREWVRPARGGTGDVPIVYEAAPGEAVFVKGSEVWAEPWIAVEDQSGVFRSKIDLERFQGTQNPYSRTISVASSDRSEAARPIPAEKQEEPWPVTLGQVFIDGKPASQVTTLENLAATANSWIVSADGSELLLHLPDGLETPNNAEIEWSVRERVFAPYRRGLGHIHVRGFRFQHCANQGPFPQIGAVSPRSGRNWVFENNEIRFAKTIGLDVGSETWNFAGLRETHPDDQRLIVQSSHIVRGNTISDNGLCGIAGWNSPGVRIYNNLIERNNRLHFSKANSSWEEWGGIKLHGTNAVIAGNLVRDNEAHGIWIDNDYNQARITGNSILGNRGSGVFLELGAGSVLVDNNVIAQTRSGGTFFAGNGVYCHDASGVRVAHNLLLDNAAHGVCMRVITDRKIWNQPVNASNEEIVNNIFLGNGGTISLPYSNPRAEGNWSDHNLYLKRAGTEAVAAPYHLNKYQGKFSWDEVHGRLVAAVTDAAEIPAAEVWRKNPRLTEAQWRLLTGWDRNSVAGEVLEAAIDPVALSLTLEFPKNWEPPTCLPVPEMDRDFTGSTIETSSVLPGPFQELGAGKSTFSIEPLRFTSPPALRGKQKLENAEIRQKKLEFTAAIEAISPAGDEVEAADQIADANSVAAWSHGLQKGKNPDLAAPFAELGRGPKTALFGRSSEGVCAGPARSVLYRVDEAAHYQVEISARLRDRRFASAGYARAQIFQLDAGRETGIELEKVDLNTPDGYRGKELADHFTWSGQIAAPAHSSIGLRFQIVAPGPAPAGDGTLEIESFSVSRLGDKD
tara:strand:+ start:7350 stop:9932 length:2583 start_codon:yes stop_codon:yes gene_type:complete